MRITSGEFGGRKLYTPKTHNIRPALDKVKAAIFNILFNVEGLRVVDLFAGTGAVGLEAISRGAAHATFVDCSREALTIIAKNIELLKVEKRTRVFPTKVGVALEYFAKHNEKFDLIFVDPPYLKNLVNVSLEQVAASGIVTPQSRIIVEHSPKEPVGEISGLVLTDSRKYGQTQITFLCQKE